MSGARLSPTANLLRNSRLFALPPALNPPAQPPTSSKVAESDSATLPYPVRASIETLPSSLARGDWGLKRPLPAKSTTRSSSSPVVRVKDVDTFEHITDFTSAADHTFTLRKWQELSLPMSLPTLHRDSTFGVPRHESVFESKHDNLDKVTGSKAPGYTRYRYKGPWLAGQTDAEFEAYIKALQRKKPQLMKELKGHLETKFAARRRREAMDQGTDLEAAEKGGLTEKEFAQAIRELRKDPEALGPVVSQLLDLPPPPRVPTDRVARKNFISAPSNLATAAYADEGPPTTHPSAGLSYLRTQSIMDNHPLFGPQEHHKPVQARILRSKKPTMGNALKALAGVAGVVTEDVNPHTFREDNAPPGITHFNPDIPGGAKYWVRTTRSSIQPNGTINLATDRASEALKATHGAGEEQKPLPDVVRGADRTVGPLDSGVPSPPKGNSNAKGLDQNQSVADYLKSGLLSKNPPQKPA
ncbi:hypothetical protein FQN54_008864 [Arachnomyces sp. PD_36]|nr:hypothetical protein FQN54_008864 [Arachnomyces sp. PD_36]